MRARSNATNLPTSPKNIAHAAKKWHAFRSLETHFVCKNTTFPAPATYPNFIKHCTCHEKWPCKITKYCNRHEEWHASINICCACYEKSDTPASPNAAPAAKSQMWVMGLMWVMCWKMRVMSELLSSELFYSELLSFWAPRSIELLYWTVTWLKCSLTELLLEAELLLAWTVSWLKRSLTQLFLDWTVPWRNCALTELLLDGTAPWLNCSLTELFLDGKWSNSSVK